MITRGYTPWATLLLMAGLALPAGGPAQSPGRRRRVGWSGPANRSRANVDFLSLVNTEHRHSGLGLHTPIDVHTGLAAARNIARATVFTTAYAALPERFVNHPPTPAALPTAERINPPQLIASEPVALHSPTARCLKVVDRFRTAQPAYGLF